MRKQILGLAALSLLLVAASCANETSESPDSGDKQLTFRTALGKQTVSRAAEFTNGSWETGNQLKVYSYLTGSVAAFKEFTLVYDKTANTWSYSPSVMSTGVPVRYYSWYPGTYTSYDPSTGLTATALSFNYAVQAVASQEDLIAAAVTTDQPDVVLGFKHILSQVNFGIVNTFGMAIEIDAASIKLSGVKDEGTYTFNGAGSGWSGLDGAADYTYIPVTGSNKTTGTETTAITYMGNEGGSGNNSNTNALMLMPQTFTAAAGTLSFQFFLTTKDEDGADKRIPDSGYLSAEVNLCDFDTATWAPGKRYLYLFDFNSYLVTGEITFRVTVADWEDDNHNTIAETLQVADGSLQSIERAIAKHSAANVANGGLATFPVAVTGDISAMTLTLIEGFDAGDRIMIAFKDATEAAKFSTNLDAANWTAAQDGRFWTLTCVTPANIASSLTSTIAEGATAAEIETEIAASISAHAFANSGNDTLQLFPIVVKGSFGDDVELLSVVPTFDAGDRIRIECDATSTANHVLLHTNLTSIWTRVQYDNIVLLIRN